MTKIEELKEKIKDMEVLFPDAVNDTATESL
jgi:hypothetical protein